MKATQDAADNETLLFRKRNSALLLIISGPAGSGKTTVVKRMVEMFYPKLQRVITTTTRLPRKGEVDKVDYHFFSKDAFQQQIKDNHFYEWAKVHNHFYGTLKREVKEHLENKVDLLLNIDVQGADSFRKVVQKEKDFPGRLITVFITPESLHELKKRMDERGLDDKVTIANRLENAKKEIQTYSNYHYCIFSKSREEDFDHFRSIYLAEKMRIL